MADRGILKAGARVTHGDSMALAAGSSCAMLKVIRIKPVQLPNPLITASRERLSGTPVFAGTRVPVQTLFDHLEAGDSLDVFLDDFPNVSREHAIAVLKASKAAIVLHSIEAESYSATADELAAVDETLDQISRGERASESGVEAAFARFRK
jgi:uncharacterized protein (DUF433 family)